MWETHVLLTAEQRKTFSSSDDFNLPQLFAPDSVTNFDYDFKAQLQTIYSDEITDPVDSSVPGIQIVLGYHKNEIKILHEYRAQSLRDLPAHAGIHFRTV